MNCTPEGNETYKAHSLCLLLIKVHAIINIALYASSNDVSFFFRHWRNTVRVDASLLSILFSTRARTDEKNMSPVSDGGVSNDYTYWNVAWMKFEKIFELTINIVNIRRLLNSVACINWLDITTPPWWRLLLLFNYYFYYYVIITSSVEYRLNWRIYLPKFNVDSKDGIQVAISQHFNSINTHVIKNTRCLYTTAPVRYDAYQRMYRESLSVSS